VSPVKYELGFYIPEDDILHSPCREKLKSYIVHIAVLNYAREQTISLKRSTVLLVIRDDGSARNIRSEASSAVGNHRSLTSLRRGACLG
jgi:hypothetical protein